MNTNELKQVLDSYISTRNNGNLKAYVESYQKLIIINTKKKMRNFLITLT